MSQYRRIAESRWGRGRGRSSAQRFAEHSEHADWLGSSRIASTPSSALYYDEAYSPFGEISGEATGTTDRNFTGQNQDLTSLFYDFPAREHHPGQGRWLSPDPLGQAAIDVTNPQSCNQYAYVGNSPLNAIDPQGLEGEGDTCGPMCQCLRALYIFYMYGGGRYTPGFSLADAQNACMGLPADTPGSGNNTGPGNGGGAPALPPAPPPKVDPKKCRPRFQKFFNLMIPLADQIASLWNTKANFILAVSAQESGYDPVYSGPTHPTPIYDPYGVTHGGGPDVNYSSKPNPLQAATDYWSGRYGQGVQGSQDIGTFAAKLRPLYGQNAVWETKINKIYPDVVRHREDCGR